MEGGWVKIWRKLKDNPRFRDPYYAALWLHLLILATHKEIDGIFGYERITLKPGQLITGRKSLSFQTGINEYTIERLLKVMKSEQQIAQQSSSKNRLITVLNWDQYQKEAQHSAQQPHNTRTHTRMEEGKKIKKTTNSVASPSAPLSGEDKKKEPTNLQSVVNHFFDLQETSEATRKVAYPRHVRDGRDLLKACSDDPKKAQAVLDALHAWAAGKKLTYTIGTALKRWKDFAGQEVAESYDERMRRVAEEVEKYKLANGIL